MNEFYTATDHFVLKPAILLALFGSALLVFDFLLFPAPKQKRWLIVFMLLGLAFTGQALWQQSGAISVLPNTAALQAAPDTGLPDHIYAFHGALVLDGFSLFFNLVFLAATLIVAIASYRYFEIEGEHHGEFYSLLLFAQCGMFFLATGTDLVTLFVGLELMAVSFYILTGFLRGVQRSNEAAVKYLLLGAFSSGFLAYGFSLLYGLSGSTLLVDVAAAIQSRGAADPLVLLALVTTAVGALFKISAAPFHMWAPDAYEGAPTPVTAHLSVASKAASFAFLLRLFLGPLASLRPVWEPWMIIAALASLTIGNLAALSQTNVKRLLAYSSISHAGYILLGLVAGNETGYQGILVYLVVYTFMNLGAFLLLLILRRKDLLGEELDDLTGLAQRSPAAALLMLLFLLSLAGLPPTAGFIGKYYILLSLVQSGHYFLAAVGAVYVAVAVYYYFRLVRSMFAGDVAAAYPPLTTSVGLRFALVITGILTLAIGLYPEPILKLTPPSSAQTVSQR